MSFHFVSYQEAKQNAQRQKVFRSNTPSFHDRFHATLHQCLYRTATTPHHSRYLPWTRPHRGDVETGACWLRCAEKHQTRAVSDSTVEVLFILFMLSYMHLNSICLVDSCESSIQAFIFYIVCLFSSVYFQCPVSSPQVAKQKSIHFDKV